MELEYLLKSHSLLKHNKIFSSAFDLNYKNKKIEAEFQKISELKYEKSFFAFALFLMFLSLSVTLFEGILFWNEPVTKSRNLKYNFIMCFCVTILSAGLLISSMIYEKKKNRIYKYASMFLMHFLLEKIFLSIISIVIVYFHLGIEIVSFTFLIKIITNLCMGLLVFRKFTVTLFIEVINTSFNHVFLLKLHVIKAIFYYIVTDIAFLIIKISFLYLFEYLTRIYFYSFIRLAKEKQYILETLSSFNVSYFMSHNYDVIDHTKMNNIIQEDQPHNGKICLKQIEKLFHNVISVENLSPDIEDYFSGLIKNQQSFKFKKFVNILKKNSLGHEKFRKFTNFSTFKLKNEINEYFYVQLFLKIKIKMKKKEASNNFLLFLGESEFEDTDSLVIKPSDVTIEGIFLDITQSYLKRESQVNSSILSKYIDDVKISLSLLNQIIEDKEFNSPIQSRMVSAINKQIPFKPKFLKENELISKQNQELSKYKKIVYKNLIDSIETVENFTKNHLNNDLAKYKSSSDMKNSIYTEKIDLRKLINSCINFYQIYVKFNPSKKNVKFLAELDPNIPYYIKSSKLLIKQVIMDLLSNAFKFTYCGDIKVFCRLKSKLELEEKLFIEITVIYSGVAAEHNNLLRLSTPFCLSTNRQGDGLGLYIVNDILQELDSKLSVHSVKNKGSSFSFILPLDHSDCFKELKIDLNASKSSASPHKIEATEYYDPIEVSELKKNLIQSERLESEFTLKEESSEAKTVVHDLPIIRYNEEDYISSSEIDGSSLSYEFKSISQGNRPDKGLNHLITNDKNKFKPYVFKSNTMKEKTDILENLNKLEKPLINKDEMVMSTNDLKNHKIKTGKKIINVLIVYDDTSYHLKIIEQLKNVSRELENQNISISPTCCHNPLEAINIIYQSFQKKEYFELILCDEYMPFMTGTNFAKVYKSILTPNGLYSVIFASLNGDSTNFELKYENEAKNKIYFDYFLNKNFKKEEIMLIIKDKFSIE